MRQEAQAGNVKISVPYRRSRRKQRGVRGLEGEGEGRRHVEGEEELEEEEEISEDQILIKQE